MEVDHAHPDDLIPRLDSLLAGDFEVEERMMVLGSVERGSWRYGFPQLEIDPSLRFSRGACGDRSLVRIDQETTGAEVVRLHHG